MKSDDEELKKSMQMTKQQLLETNIRQRGDVGGSAKKVGLRIKELERLYGIQNGGDRKSDDAKSKPQNSVLITQEDLAAKLGMSVDTLQNYKALADMIPELDDMVKDGNFESTEFQIQQVNTFPVEKLVSAAEQKPKYIVQKMKTKSEVDIL